VLIPERRLARSLLSLPLGVFLVMLMWTLDKLINPDHAARIFRTFYFLGSFGTPVLWLIGIAELALLLLFLLGVWKGIS
jgi:putative oxidoreductase